MSQDAQTCFVLAHTLHSPCSTLARLCSVLVFTLCDRTPSGSNRLLAGAVAISMVILILLAVDNILYVYY